MSKLTKENFIKAQGELIRKERERKGFTQQEVADALGISRVQVCNVERGENGTSPEKILALSVLFKCNVVRLFPTKEYKELHGGKKKLSMWKQPSLF
jgi:transcriptional regulator with XRE-family HTH domain